MAREGDRKRRRRVQVLSVNALEDRVVPSAGAALAEIQYLRAINRLSSDLLARVDHANARLTSQVVRIDAQYQGALAHSAARLSAGPRQAVRVQAKVARASTQAEVHVDRLAAAVAGQVNAATNGFEHRAATLNARFGHSSAMARSANPYFQRFFQEALTVAGDTLNSEARSAQTNVRATAAVVAGATPQAAMISGARPAAVAQAASAHMADARQAQHAADKAALARFRSEYYASFNPLRDAVAAVASSELPPVHLGGGRVTGPNGQSGLKPGINLTGSGTVTFTGIVGAEGTSGTGTGLASGVGGTAGAGNNLGSGTTTITGGGTGTTGTGATVTAGNGANGNGIGATTSAAGTGAGVTGVTGTTTTGTTSGMNTM
ncbi:MAG: hypothetical protein ACYC61_19210 [Isosphaeraceae bacterium]